ncbi:hypothetical protein VCSRO35_3308 [Vibrio cholerae]|nr:hypothetical protein VCSRO35_3308 [Vibrio cholerae]
MFDDLPTLTHAEQQAAVEKIQKLMAEGISTAEAILAVVIVPRGFCPKMRPC